MQTPDGLGVTPPDKAIALPLTPPSSAKGSSPAVTAVLRIFALHRAGQLSPWTKTKISPEEHTELWRRLPANARLCRYVEEKVRYDFDPEYHLLVTRMPTATHDAFIAKIVENLLFQLKTISESLPPAEAKTISQIQWQNTSRIVLRDEPGAGGDETDYKLNPKYPMRYPDAHFRHSSEKYSHVVIEVSYTQKHHNLPYLAESYIIGSGGSIGLVIAFDISYGGRSSKATISMWRPRTWVDDAGVKHLEVIQVIDQVPFRSADGTPTSGTLSLRLLDFVLPETFRDVRPSVQDTPISITHEVLAEYLEAAEDNEKKAQAGLTRLPAHEQVVVHKREWSPEEEYDSDDDRGIVERESRKARKTDEKDEDWVELAYHAALNIAFSICTNYPGQKVGTNLATHASGDNHAKATGELPEPQRDRLKEIGESEVKLVVANSCQNMQWGN
ncbi:hypothetical protein GP486_000241 [Trichoglossum hirsutum]|uniref:Uncharacterized protein n=1 Tax=Trichoglossum hirsutum TaxID=265104 RepID=A0A9P8RU41_9PEZI|nr:hypothetical protein GP486_000241 [Trichoglossum hirsutum]